MEWRGEGGVAATVWNCVSLSKVPYGLKSFQLLANSKLPSLGSK